MQIKINAATLTVNGKRVTVKIVRNSYWAHVFKKDMLLIGNTIHYRANRLRMVMVRAGLDEVEKLHTIGYIKYYWNLLTSN